MKIQHYVAGGLICLLAVSCNASRRGSSSRASMAGKTPDDVSWIRMMDDPNVNYFAAVKSFEDFWRGKTTPTTEHDLFSADDKEEALERSSYSSRRAQNDPAVKYRFEYKKFVHWKEEMAPYVQPDGRILSADERIQIWKQQKSSRQ